MNAVHRNFTHNALNANGTMRKICGTMGFVTVTVHQGFFPGLADTCLLPIPECPLADMYIRIKVLSASGIELFAAETETIEDDDHPVWDYWINTRIW